MIIRLRCLKHIQRAHYSDWLKNEKILKSKKHTHRYTKKNRFQKKKLDHRRVNSVYLPIQLGWPMNSTSIISQLNKSSQLAEHKFRH